MGAWDVKAFDNDTAMDWIDGIRSSLEFLICQGLWSRYQEEGIAACELLVSLPEILKCEIGPRLKNEALEAVELEMGVSGDWDDPKKRMAALVALKKRIQALPKPPKRGENIFKIVRKKARAA